MKQASSPTQPALGAWDAGLLALALAATGLSVAVARRRRLLRLRPFAGARDDSGLPASAWLALGLALFGAWMLSAQAGAAAASRAWGSPAPDDLRRMGAVATAAYAGAILAILAMGGFLAKPLRRAGLWRRPTLRDIKAGLIGLLLVLPLMWLLLATGGVIEGLWGGEPDSIAHETLRALRAGGPASIWWWATIAGAVVLAPVFEEWLYRGFVQTALRSAVGSAWIAIVGSAVVFMLAHVGGGADLRTLPSLLVFGLGLGALLERTGSIWPSVAAHAAFNALNVALALAIP